MPDLLTEAQRLLALGFSVIPLDHPDDPVSADPSQAGKVPAIKWNAFQQARSSPDNLTAWFGNGRRRNIGIVTGGISDLVVVDTDTPDAEAWADGHLPQTPMQVLTAKGRHRYYRHPGVPVPNKVGIRPGVDVRGDGGYVVGPGSTHPTRVVYRAPARWPDTLEQVPIFNPAWLRQGAEPTDHWPPAVLSTPVPPDRGRRRARVRAYLDRTPPAIAGQGGDLHTFQVCCRVVRGFQLDPGEALELLRDWNERCVPPWTERELQAKVEGALHYGREPLGGRAAAADSRSAHTTRPREEDDPFPLTDSGNAEAFAAWHGDRVRFDHRRQRFLLWGGHRFVPDADADVERLAKETIRRRQAYAFELPDPDRRKAALKWAITSESRPRREAMLALARSERPIADTGVAWDGSGWLLGAPNAVVDLQTGQARPGNPSDRITMNVAVPFDPGATCPLWERTVREVLGEDDELVEHIQRALGYCLTGITTEQCFWTSYGFGSNGKSTVLNTFRRVIGDYGYQMPFSTVLLSRREATNDLAALDGRRFVLASEANDGVRFDEARIKALTGCDTITARFLYAEFFEFVPVAKFWLSVNHKPIVRDDSHSFWRRLRLVPFLRTFPVNPRLADQLWDEAPGILAWAVRGALLWQAEGLGDPVAVRSATDSYRSESDMLGEYLADVCVVEPTAEVGAREFFQHYKRWAERRGLTDRERLSATMFGRKATERFEKEGKTAGAFYKGVRLRPFPAESDS